MLRGLALPPNNRVRSHITAAKPPLTALRNNRAPLVVLGRQESVCRVVVCKLGARSSHTHRLPPLVVRLPLSNGRKRRS
jgi:hypothetical protein